MIRRYSRKRASRRAFSLIEMMVALVITATLLAASLSALDASFKSYKNTTEAASTHVVTRIVMHRVLTMIRTGDEFGPYPVDVLDPAQNPLESEFIEFVTLDDPATGTRQIAKIEDATTPANGRILQLTLTTFENGVQTEQEVRPLITGLVDAVFTLEYDVGPRLRKATVDITVMPNDFQDAGLFSELEAPTIRLVASSQPRGID